jgi:hypothetical protein
MADCLGCQNSPKSISLPSASGGDMTKELIKLIGFVFSDIMYFFSTVAFLLLQKKFSAIFLSFLGIGNLFFLLMTYGITDRTI